MRDEMNAPTTVPPLGEEAAPFWMRPFYNRPPFILVRGPLAQDILGKRGIASSPSPASQDRGEDNKTYENP